MLRELGSSPKILPLYAKAAAPLLPGASMLPFLPGGGNEIPELELGLSAVRSDQALLAAYAKVCGFTLRDQLPATYPHILAFPLHMALMTDGSFPFGAVGLVHVANEIVQHRPIELGEQLRLRVKATPLQSHQRGRSFSILTNAFVDEQLVWQERSTMLRRGGGAEGGDAAKTDVPRARVTTEGEERDTGLRQSAEWRLQGDLGRRYAAVSGDRNPIHMHALSAKLFGFPKAIAHGMWSKARCLATLEGRLPDAFSIEVSFKRPILLPGKVILSEAEQPDGWTLQLDDARSENTHLVSNVKRNAKEMTGT
jgi:MaoC like domain